jgi:hypothetical protein
MRNVLLKEGGVYLKYKVHEKLGPGKITVSMVFIRGTIWLSGLIILATVGGYIGTNVDAIMNPRSLLPLHQ